MVMAGIVPHLPARGAATLAWVARGVHAGFGDLDGLANAQPTFDRFDLMPDDRRHFCKGRIDPRLVPNDIRHPLVVDSGPTHRRPGIIAVQHVPQHL